MAIVHETKHNVMTPMSSYHIFDRQQIKKNRNRAAQQFMQYDFFLREICARLGDRLLDVKRQFPTALNLGAYNGVMAEYIPASAGVKTLIHAEQSTNFLTQIDGLKVQTDEEFLPFADNSFDLVLCPATLHFVNDLPGSLIQIYRALKPGGMFLACMPGGESLKELRASMESAELTMTAGISPRICPFIDVKDAGALLQRAGFILPVADSDALMIGYQQPLKLMADLRGNAQNNAMTARSKRFLRRQIFHAALEYYQRHYKDSGRYMATAEIITLTGWKPDALAPPAA